MPKRGDVDPAEVRRSVLEVAPWLRDSAAPRPPRPQVAAAVRLTARALAKAAPGASVEVRVPPYVAVQCIEGPRHTRGTPPNVVEADPRSWLLLATGLIDLDAALAAGTMTASGSRATEIGHWLPIVPL